MEHESSPTYYPPVAPYTSKKSVTFVHGYDPGHVAPKSTAYVAKHHKHHAVDPVVHAAPNQCKPIVCDPQYVFHDCYVPREVPIVQPVIHVQRKIIVNVPRHYVQPMVKHKVIDPGCPC